MILQDNKLSAYLLLVLKFFVKIKENALADIEVLSFSLKKYKNTIF